MLGSILAGFATPTEAAAVGAVGALAIALARRSLSLERLREVMRGTARLTSMVFVILLGASVFSLVFRGFGGDVLIHDLLSSLPGGPVGALAVVMLVMFLLGFIIDFIEIIYIVVAIVAPVLLAMGMDPVWLGVMMAVNLQTSFLTPPFGFALVLPARRRAAHGPHGRHLPRRGAVHRPAARDAGRDVVLAAARHLAAGPDLRLTPCAVTRACSASRARRY